MDQNYQMQIDFHIGHQFILYLQDVILFGRIVVLDHKGKVVFLFDPLLIDNIAINYNFSSILFKMTNHILISLVISL